MQLATRPSTGAFARDEPSFAAFMILICTGMFSRACRRGVNLLVKPLLDAGADLEAKNKAGATPMIESARGLVCAKSGCQEIYKLFLSVDARVSIGRIVVLWCSHAIFFVIMGSC